MNFNRLMKSNNPMIKEEVVTHSSPITRGDGAMTLQGTVNKCFALFGILLAVGAFSYMNPNRMFIMGGFIAGFVISLIASRSPEKSNIWAPIFAACYGLALGSLSAVYAAAYNGILFHAVTITLSIFFSMLFLYKTGIITVTDKFRSIIMTLTGGIMILYLVSFGMHMFGFNMPFLHDQSMIGIGISLFIAGVASMKLLVDFDNVDRGVNAGAPNYVGWSVAMGLLFTMVWLYTEILYLVSAFMGSD